MITYLNQKLRFLLIFLLGIIAISFVFFGSWTPSRNAAYGVAGMIEGRNISHEEFAAAVQEARMMQAFRTGRFLEQTNNEDSYLFSQAWSRLVALDAAQKGGIQTLDEEVVEEIKNNPLFRDEKGYQSDRYQRFTIYYLTPQGINLDRFHEMVRHDITINKLIGSIARTASVRPEEVEKAMQDLFSEAHVELVYFPLETLKKGIQPTPQQLKDFFEKAQENYKSPEERNVEFVVFKLSSEDEKLPDAERKKAFKRLTEEAFYFTGLFLGGGETQVSPDSFKESAEEKHLVVLTGSVTQTDEAKNVQTSQSRPNTLPPPSASLDTSLIQQPKVKQAVFKLTHDNPVSDYIPIENGLLVCHLLNVKAPKPLAYEAVQTQVREDFINQRARELTNQQAENFSKTAQEKLSKFSPEGSHWEEVATQLKQKSMKLPPFTTVKGAEGDADYIEAVNQAVPKLQAKEMIVVPTPKGAAVIYLETRTPPSEQSRASFSKRIEEQILMQRQMQLVDEWLIHLMTQPNTKLPPQVLKNLKQEV